METFTIKGEYGDIVQRRWRPVKNAGIYIPGGRAAYPSTVLMNAIPAQLKMQVFTFLEVELLIQVQY